MNGAKSSNQQPPLAGPPGRAPSTGIRRIALPADEDSRGQRIAAVMKLGSALCLLVAVGLFTLPLARQKLATAPPAVLQELAVASKQALNTSAVEEPGANGSAANEPTTAQPVQETRAAFKGAILMLESVPSGASTRVSGVDQGETPVSVGLDCSPGTTVVVEFTMRYFEKTVYNTPCPKDAVVTVKARMRRGSGKASGKR